MPSLQDQLLKAGMIDKGKAQRIKKEKQKQRKQNAKSGSQTDEAKALAEQARKEKLARDKEITEQRKRVEREKEIAAQIRQLIEVNRVDRRQGETAYQFPHDKVIRKIYVTSQQHQELVKGKLAIVTLNNEYELVPAPVADKIAERDDSYVVARNVKADNQVDEDDPYADYQIPDDLMW